MLRVYVAGAYSADNVVDVLANMRRGIELSVYVLKAGMAPFCPWLDFQFGLLESVQLDEYYTYSIAWLKASDAMLVGRIGLEGSVGTAKEIQIARANGIPVFYSLKELLNWRESFPKQEHPRVRESKTDPAKVIIGDCFGGRDDGFKSILREMAELHDKKERDYGMEGDPLANIRGSEDFNVPAWMGCEVRLNDKQRRIHNFIRKGELVNESVEDSLLDRAVYSVIALQLYREQVRSDEHRYKGGTQQRRKAGDLPVDT